MTHTASLDRDLRPVEAVSRKLGLSRELLARRVGYRRQMLLVQAVGFALLNLVPAIYCYAGTISIAIPTMYSLSGFGLIAFFLVLSESHFGDRFEDHYLTIFQIAGHVMIQLLFLMAVPEIGFAFLSVVFVIFGFGALRMTTRQAAIAWTLTTMGVAPIFLMTRTPIGLPVESGIERFAAMLSYVLTVGLCAFMGLYGSSLRKMLYDRSSQLKEAYRRIEELAEIDELTGACNRRSIMRMLDEEISRAGRLSSPCSIALIDLDHFKRINDDFGHPIGDEVLRTFAITMFANVRAIDRFGRYGGEEFLLLLPDTAEPSAARMLDRLRGIVSDLDWSAFSTEMQVTISAGVATLRPDETSESFLTRADRALYASKAGGRNRITSA